MDIVSGPAHVVFDIVGGETEDGKGAVLRVHPDGRVLLSDADVERIARRVAELLREASPCTSASAPLSSS